MPRGVTGKIWSGYGLDGSGDGGSFSAAITSDTTISTSIGGSTTGGDFIIPTLPEDLVLEMTTTQAKVNLSIAASWTGRDIDPSTFSLYIGAVGSGVAGMKVREVRLGNTHLYPARRISDDVLGLSDTAGNFYAVSGTWTAGNIVPSVLKQNNLHNIYLAWEDREAGDTKTFSMLLNLLNGYLADGWTPRTYHTIDPNTKQINTGQGPRLYGEVKINEGFYADLLDKFNIAETTDITISGVVWKRAKISNFGGLYLFYNPDLTWIRFEDPEVERLCVEKWDTSGDGGLGLGEAKKITSLDASLFKGNTKIKYFNELQYFTSINRMQNSQFMDCESLQSLILPNGITRIENAQFQNCKMLTNLILPESITSIYPYAFVGCTNLALTELPSGITEILDFAFSGCTNLALTELPPGLTSIVRYLFNGCTKLALTKLPPGITGTIGDYAFSGCTNLALTELPPGITAIGSVAFSGCTNLALTELPPGLTGSIGYMTFSGCTNLAITTLPDGITSIGGYAFSGCTSIPSLTINAATPPSVDRSSFGGTSFPFYVPSDSVDTYKTASGWSTYASRIFPIPE